MRDKVYFSPIMVIMCFLADETIGIIGCGHLGRTLAEELIDHGLPRERLMISYGGSASTLET
jgi:pyrroline-5-carboxylate reductase